MNECQKVDWPDLNSSMLMIFWEVIFFCYFQVHKRSMRSNAIECDSQLQMVQMVLKKRTSGHESVFQLFFFITEQGFTKVSVTNRVQIGKTTSSFPHIVSYFIILFVHGIYNRCVGLSSRLKILSGQIGK